MRKFIASLLLTVGLISSMATAEAHAQLLSKLKLGFVVPQGADPPILVDFLSFGTPVSISGADLLDHGVEIHDLIPSQEHAGYIVDVTQIELKFIFNHPVSIAFGSGVWAPWQLTIESGAPNYDLVFEGQGPIGSSGGSSPINENFDPSNGQIHAFGLLNATPINDTDHTLENDFRNATIEITPLISGGAIERGAPNVPEPGTITLGVSLLAGLTIPMLKSRRRN